MSSQKSPLTKRVDQLRAALKSREPEQLALQTNTIFQPGEDGRGQFHFSYWEEAAILPARDYVARRQATREALRIIDQAMILYYFHDSQSSGASQGWISFSELPDGQFYNSAFQGYTSKKILQGFKRDYATFHQAARNIGGKETPFASIAYRVQILPQVAALIACWKGDADISPSYQILFQDTVKYHLPTDGCAILGSMIASKLLREKGHLTSDNAQGKTKQTQGREL
ncbi:MAG: DUF3786 domain-containing protein [Anaerolineales bacterium]